MNDVQVRRFSLRELSQKVEQQIFRHLPIHTQSSDSLQKIEMPIRKHSEPIDFVPVGHAGGNS
jgi:hypothetical protein